MSEKRRDKKGRVLRSGESQRADNSYKYRYTDIHGNRKYVYAPTLEELRTKEASIIRDLNDGIDYSGGEISVIELVERYIGIKRGLRKNTMRAYGTAMNHVRESYFGRMKVREVKLSDAKRWFVSLHDSGMKQNTIGVIQSIVRPAFEMAVDDDIIRKNPFKFTLSELIPNDAYVREALTKQQQEIFLKFVLEHCHAHCYDEMLILLGTGMRVSEMYGLTKSDIDFKERRIYIRRQLCRTAENPYFVTEPKTKSGIRCLPMSPTVYETFLRVVNNRIPPKVEMLIDGCSGFLFLDKNGYPKVAMHLQNTMRKMNRKYQQLFGNRLPNITPHVLRHTFCTNMQQAGLDVKSLQYMMGHSTASVTLDVYSHTDYDAVERAFRKVL